MKTYIEKIKTSVALLAVALGMASCGDFLEIEPKTFVSEDNFWNEKADVDQMVAGVYTSMQSSGFVERCIMWGETRSDNISGGDEYDKNTNVYRVLKENLLPTNAYTKWIDFYSVINKCNTIIAMAPTVSEKDPVYTASDVRATIAEMTCVRDLCYFYLVRAFKDVPYYTYPITSEKEANPQPAVDGDYIVRTCISELEAVVGDALKAYPKNGRFNSTTGRVTQNAIYALLTDMCLWDNQYQKAVDYAQHVIDAKQKDYEENYSHQTSFGGGSAPAQYQFVSNLYTGEKYPLYPCYSGSSFGADFKNIFGEGNSFESIFELDFSYDGSDGNYIANHGMGNLYGTYSSETSEGKGPLGVPENMLTDLTQKTYSIFRDAYDERFYTNIRADEEYTKGFVGKGVVTDASVEKIAEKNNLSFGTTFKHNVNTNRNWIFYRLTDVMLMQAEALVELAGDDLQTEGTDEEGNPTTVVDEKLAKAFSIVWTVNRRSELTNSTTGDQHTPLLITDNASKAGMRELVMNERRRELMFEGKRWFDLLRHYRHDGNLAYISAKVPAKITTGTSSTLFVNPESLYWPYNKEEVKINTALDQKAFYGSNGDEESFQSTNK